MTLAALLAVLTNTVAACSTGSTPTVPTAINALSATNTTSPATASNSAAAGADWTTYHRDNVRSGYLPDMPDPQQLAVAWNTQLDGAVYAEPLVVSGHIIVATENNSLYSLNADTGQVEWHTNIGNPATRSELPCGNIDPLGMTGTPVYDSASGLIFAVAEASGPAHLLVGLDARTGEIKVRRSADLAGMEPAPHQQRAALALSQGMVYIAYGGLFGDCGNYQGTVIGSRTDGSGELLSYRVPTSPRRGDLGGRRASHRCRRSPLCVRWEWLRDTRRLGSQRFGPAPLAHAPIRGWFCPKTVEAR